MLRLAEVLNRVRHPGAVVQPEPRIDSHRQTGFLQSLHHRLGGRGAAAGGVLDRVEPWIEAPEIMDRFRAVACRCFGRAHCRRLRLQVGADNQYSLRLIPLGGQGLERTTGRTWRDDEHRRAVGHEQDRWGGAHV